MTLRVILAVFIVTIFAAVLVYGARAGTILATRRPASCRRRRGLLVRGP